MTHILIPREPSAALLRPFIGCNTQELHEAWAAMVRIAEVQHARAGSQYPAQIEQSATLAGTPIEQYARMFDAACKALGQVSDCLGINSDIDPGAEPIIAAIEQLRAGSTHPLLDDRWKARMLDGRAPERDEMGFGNHPELPSLDEGMMPRSFFAALGLELAHTSAEDQLDWGVLGAMSEAVNWTDWLPTPPHGDGWKLVSIFDTEDGPVAWWLRELPEAEDGTTTIRNLQAEVENLKASAARVRAAPAAVAPQGDEDDSLLLCASDLQHSAIYDSHSEMQDCARSVADRIKALAARALAAPALEAPAAPAGWKLVPEQPTQDMCESAKHGIDARLSVFKWADGYKAMLAAAPQAPAAPWKDHQTARLVNDLRDCAIKYHGAGQLRERIAHIVVPLCDQLKGALAAPAAPAVDALAPVQALLDVHAALLDANPYAYFELAYTRQTGWMAWITDKPFHGPVINPDRKVLARGQGDTASEACAAAAQAKEGGA